MAPRQARHTRAENSRVTVRKTALYLVCAAATPTTHTTILEVESVAADGSVRSNGY
jgi:hypothetical protein